MLNAPKILASRIVSLRRFRVITTLGKMQTTRSHSDVPSHFQLLGLKDLDLCEITVEQLQSYLAAG